MWGDMRDWLMDVSIHAPAQGATYHFSVLKVCYVVSIHAPAQGATNHCGGVEQSWEVSIHAPAQGATSRLGKKQRLCVRFQSTPPRRGRRLTSPTLSRLGKFQSTPPRRGRPNSVHDARERVLVSIHAPAQGATGPGSGQDCGRPGFNPRPRAGGDPWEPCRFARHQVSIHAPAQGATAYVRAVVMPFKFQSTPPRRGRLS